MRRSRIGKVAAGVLAGSLCFVAVAGSLYRSQAEGGQSSSQRESALAQVGDQVGATPARDGGMKSEEKAVRDAYARLMRYHTAARDEAAASRGVIYRAGDYMTFGVNNLKTGFIEEISNRPLSELVTPRGGDIITLKPNYLRGADGLAHASYGALWGGLPEVETPDQTTGPTVMQVVGEKYKGAVKYTSYEATVSLEGKRRSYRAMALHFNPGRADGKPETEILDNITSEMNTVLAERSPRVRSPWAKYVKSDLHEAIVNSIRAKEQAGAPLIPVDAPIGYLPGDDVEAANNLLASAADSCDSPPPPPSVTISDVKAVIKGGFADFEITLNPSPSELSVNLDIGTLNGTGQALFDINNSAHLTINESTTVRIKGVTESSSVNNITLQASFDDVTLATKNFTVIKLELKEVAFDGSIPIRKDDDTGIYTAPHWQDNSSPLDGDADDPDDRKYPVAMLRNTKMKASAKWIITPTGGLSGVTTTVKGDGPGNIDIPAATATVSSSELNLAFTEASNPFPNTIKIYDPLIIQWKVSFTGATDAAVGESRNQVYITRSTPLVPELIHTLVHLSCKNADGKAGDTPDGINQIISSIWSEFTDLNVERVDGLQLAYYRTYTCSNVTTKLLIKNGEGQCGSWAKLFIDLLKVQGIDQTDDYVIVEPNDGTSQEFLVKNWSFLGSGSSSVPTYPYLNVYKVPFRLETEYNFLYEEFTDSDGIAGQGITNPSSIFANHQIVKIGSVYYDPSYGVTYTSLADMDDRAIAGYLILATGTLDEPVYDRDFNGNGNKTDLGVPVLARVAKKNPAGSQLKETISNY
jgi:hypothetical protein